jgi:hypothetical protein
MSSPLIRSGSSMLRRLAIVASLFALVGTSSAQTNDPAITSQPVAGTTALGEDWEFAVEVVGTAPFFYQWFQNDHSIPDATNSIYTIESVTRYSGGIYTVVITNAVGRAVSDPATLTLSETSPRNIRNGNLSGDTVIRVPILFSGNGREYSVSFSLRFDTNIFSNPGWENRGTNSFNGTNTFELDLSEADNGHVGLTVDRPDLFPAQTYLLGNFTFDRSLTNDPFAAMLQFTNTPTPSEARTTRNVAIGMQGGVYPQVARIDTRPFLDRQSGLMQQRLLLSYPGAQTITNVDIAVGNLQDDTLTNRVTLFNRIGHKLIDTTGYGHDEYFPFAYLPFASAGEFGPATQRLLTMEYYVSDKITVPEPEYYLDLGLPDNFAFPNAATPLNITTNRYLNGTYVIQFPTIANYIYYVNYAESLDDLVNNGPTSRFSRPAVVGTGFSVQWIDNGPPKTVSLPTNGMRFYRLIELPVN